MRAAACLLGTLLLLGCHEKEKIAAHEAWSREACECKDKVTCGERLNERRGELLVGLGRLTPYEKVKAADQRGRACLAALWYPESLPVPKSVK